MADYIDILDAELEVRDPGTVGIFSRLRDNMAAIAEGALGAPKIQGAALDSLVVTDAKLGAGAVTEGKIGSGAVTEAKLDSSAVDQTNLETDFIDSQVISNSNNDFTGTVGQYGFFPMPFQASFSYYASLARSATNTSAKTYLAIESGTSTRVSWRYVLASPPYDMGNGPVPLFVFVARKDGEIIAAHAARTPPWAYQGPTRVQSDFEYDGKRYQLRRNGPSLSDVLSGAVSLSEYLASLRNGDIEAVEVTQSVKNADMEQYPHPWIDVLPDGAEVLLVDPVGEFIHDAAALHAAGHSVIDLLVDGMITLGAEIERNGPPGVKIVEAQWAE